MLHHTDQKNALKKSVEFLSTKRPKLGTFSYLHSYFLRSWQQLPMMWKVDSVWDKTDPPNGGHLRLIAKNPVNTHIKSSAACIYNSKRVRACLWTVITFLTDFQHHTWEYYRSGRYHATRRLHTTIAVLREEAIAARKEPESWQW